MEDGQCEFFVSFGALSTLAPLDPRRMSLFPEEDKTLRIGSDRIQCMPIISMIGYYYSSVSNES
jgi:hypothetical protein